MFVIDGPIAAADVPRLCERLGLLLRDGEAEVVVCDVCTMAADAASIEALARLQLTARRRGRRISLRGASADLDRLVSFVGLADVLRGRRLDSDRRIADDARMSARPFDR